MKKSFPLLLHGFCLASIFGLAAFVAHEKTSDCDLVLQQELQFAYSNAAQEIRNHNQKLQLLIEKYSRYLPIETNQKHNEKAKTAAAATDSMLLLLDNLDKKPNLELAAEVQGQLNLHRSRLHELLNFEEMFDRVFPKFEPADWLFQSLKNDSPEQFSSVVAQAKIDLLLIENACLNFCASKIGGGDFRVDRFEPVLSFDQIFPAAGERVAADFCLGWIPEDLSYRFRFLLDGKVLAQDAERASFRVRFDSAGFYPLRFSLERLDWRSDSVFSWEKTYVLKVRE